MILFLLAYLGGALTILSPCILPVLPFVFSRADRPFLRSGLPLLAGMTATFVLIATLASVGGGWAVQANEYGRDVAVVLLAVFGVTLLFPAIGDRLMYPVVALGSRLSQSLDHTALGNASILPSVGLGVATGLLWAPCAGPVLGLILTGAALNGASVQTSLLLLAYAAGAASSLALALVIGGRVFVAMKRSLGVGEWIRRGIGVAVLLAVVAIATGMDTGFLTQISSASTTSLEQSLLDKFRQPQQAASASLQISAGDELQSLEHATQWLNSPPLTPQALKGHVVLVDFWTYSCINCLRALPYIRAWAQKYKEQGLIVIGVHAPEFAFEHNVANVQKAVSDLHIAYPVAIDNDFAIWRAFENEAWPAHYFVDANGMMRRQHSGEGEYDEDERFIQQLLAEAGHAPASKDLVSVAASGAELAADASDIKSPETYIGYFRAENFSADGPQVHDAAHLYQANVQQLNQWGLSGDWTVAATRAVLNTADGRIAYRFHARDLHLVLGTAAGTAPVHFQITIDGKPPGSSHGVDTDADGNGVITDERLYQLVRQFGPVADHTFEIRFLQPGAAAYSFTFG